MRNRSSDAVARNSPTMTAIQMNHLASIDTYLDEKQAQFENDLCELLKIPSVSADRNYASSVADAANWVAKQFEFMGLSVDIIQTDGHPIVYAESPKVLNRPTVLVYGHYDVQPPDPLDEWDSPPFEPTRRDGDLFARGATDDKGQMMTHIKSAQAWMAVAEELPVQLKFLIEGEEEVGSPGLNEYLAKHSERLNADVCVISDTCQFGRGQPAITYGLKGIAYFELRLDGPNQDLHSGSFGGGVTNPANTLAGMLAAIIDERGKIQIPNFYDDVKPLTEKEREQFAALPFNEAAFMDQIGVEALSGEHGFSTLERRWARPTFDINGLTSGYQGEGSKTVLPSYASAKFSFRLVPDQDPEKVCESLKSMLEGYCPPGIRMTLTAMHGAPGVVVPLDSPYVTAAAQAIEHGFGHPPVFIREGGSIPIVTQFKQKLGIDTLLLGWGLDDDHPHGPNEKFSITDYHRGIKASARLWHELSKIEIE